MNNEEYTMEMNRLAMTAGLLADCDLDSILETIHMAQSVGPIMDPTRYQHGGFANLFNAEKLVNAAMAVRNVIREFQVAAAARALRGDRLAR